MKRLLAGMALTALLGATPSMAFDAARLQQLLTTKVCVGCDLSYADLRNADLSRADLRNANLTGADLTGADLTFVDLRNANLTGADLTGADLAEADWTGATITDVLRDFFAQWVDGIIFLDEERALVGVEAAP